MNEEKLIQALETVTDRLLANELVIEFIKIRQDCATKTLERASAGKFVETFVQCLQHMATSEYDKKPSVDKYLSNKVESEARIPDGLRVCGSRIARSMYTLRNKRNIAHKGGIDPNSYDLEYLYQSAAWILAEMVREAKSITMEEAGALIDRLRAPIGPLIEEIDGTRLVHANTSLRGKILILLHSCYPYYMSIDEICTAVNSVPNSSVRSRISELKCKGLIFRKPQNGFRLTVPGYNTATEEIANLSN